MQYITKMIRKNNAVQSLPRRLLCYFAPLFFLLACVIAVAIGYLASSVLIYPFTHNPITIGIPAGSLLYFLFTGVIFAVFTCVVVVVEKSQNNFIIDHFRHMILFYVLFTLIASHEHATLYQAFLSAVDAADANNDELVTAIYTAKRTLTVLGTFAIIIVSNFITLYLAKKSKNKTT
ncbi:MAG: hypothetical protein Q7R99_04190 [bacterium]|nr:hypothetical protein [bacterium]